MGTVFLAYDTTLRRHVAIKVVAGAAGEAGQAQVLREARNAAALNHPNICTIYEVGAADEVAFIAMEYAEGRSLHDRLKDGRLPFDEALRYGRQTAEALAYAHDHDVIHRDLKAANVIVGSDGRLRIIDFGLARRADAAMAGATTVASIVSGGLVAGTPYAMAPEQVRGEAADRRTDIWALGVLLYEMVSGDRPFVGSTTAELFSSILRDPPGGLPADTPALLVSVIQRCLEKDPERRWQQASEVAAALEAAGASVPRLLPNRLTRLGLRWLLRAAAALAITFVALALGFDLAGVRTRLMSGGAPVSSIRLAVLPFENLTGDPGQEFFSDGLTEEMITELGRLQPDRLSVIARTSSMRYKKSTAAIDQICRELRVEYLLEGSARRERNRVRIVVQLIRAQDQTPLWSDSYEGDLSSILSTQSAAARRVASALKVALLPDSDRQARPGRTVDPEAYESYLRGRFQSYSLSSSDLDAALQHFRRAIQRDPAFAPAHVGVAFVWLSREQMGLIGPEAGSANATAAALEALALDPASAEAHYVLALIRTQQRQWQNAEEEFQRAIALNPAFPDARAFHSHLLNLMGHPAEARAQIDRALEIDPLNPLFLALDAVDYLFEARPDRAAAQALEALKTAPGQPVALNALWAAYDARSDTAGAAAAAVRYLTAVGQPATAEVMERAYAAGGYRAAMKTGADRLVEAARSGYATPSDVAQLALAGGDAERAIEWLQRSVAENDPNAAYIDLFFAAIRGDPRVRALRRTLNLPEP